MTQVSHDRCNDRSCLSKIMFKIFEDVFRALSNIYDEDFL